LLCGCTRSRRFAGAHVVDAVRAHT
jgi:hypothetical protein